MNTILIDININGCDVKMKFCELEMNLQNKLNKADYHNNLEIRNIVNRALATANNNIDFLAQLCKQLEILLCDINMLTKDISGSLELQSERENQLPPNES